MNGALNDGRTDSKGIAMDQHVTLADDELWGAPAPAPAGETGKRSHARRWVVAAFGTVAIGVAAVVGANLASSSTQGLATGGRGGPGGGPGRFGGFGGPGGFGGRGDNGTIASIDGSTIKLTTKAGTTVNVVTSASTTVSVSSTGAVSDVKVGDNVRVLGTTSGTTVAADQITDSGATALADGPGAGRGGPPAGAFQGGTPPNGAANANRTPGNANGGPANGTPPNGAGGFRDGGPPTTGVVKTVNGGTFTITATDGTNLTVTTSSATQVTIVKPGTLQSLKTGDAIQVNGTTASDGTITASSIRSGAVTAGR